MALQTSSPPSHSAEDQREKFVALCEWIKANLDKDLTWEHLIGISGWSHKVLINLFSYFLQTTPMMFIKTARHGNLRSHRLVPLSGKKF